MLKTMWNLNFWALALILLCNINGVFAENSRQCEINGQIFKEGENVGSAFVSRCGPPTSWPCYCNPDVPLQVDCPYCSFATSTDNLIRCAKHEETVTFISLFDDTGKKCSCDATDPSNPVKVCEDDESAEMCHFDVEGQSYWYTMGDKVDVLGECNDTTNYPCYCSPNVNGQLYCPYCTIAHGDSVECIKDREIKQLNIFDQGQSCQCDYSLRVSANFPAYPDCAGHNGCSVEEEDGSFTFYNAGEEIQGKEGICGEGFPYICDNRFGDDLLYPYCSFVTQGGGTICARDTETVTFIDRFGKQKQCECQITALGQGEETCMSINEPSPSSTPPPSSSGSTTMFRFTFWISSSLSLALIFILNKGVI